MCFCALRNTSYVVNFRILQWSVSLNQSRGKSVFVVMLITCLLCYTHDNPLNIYNYRWSWIKCESFTRQLDDGTVYTFAIHPLLLLLLLLLLFILLPSFLLLPFLLQFFFPVFFRFYCYLSSLNFNIFAFLPLF